MTFDGQCCKISRRDVEFGVLRWCVRFKVGCNSVSDPATFLGPRTVVYALTSIRKGFYGPNEVLKNKPFEAGVIERAAFVINKL